MTSTNRFSSRRCGAWCILFLLPLAAFADTPKWADVCVTTAFASDSPGTDTNQDSSPAISLDLANKVLPGIVEYFVYAPWSTTAKCGTVLRFTFSKSSESAWFLEVRTGANRPASATGLIIASGSVMLLPGSRLERGDKISTTSWQKVVSGPVQSFLRDQFTKEDNLAKLYQKVILSAGTLRARCDQSQDPIPGDNRCAVLPLPFDVHKALVKSIFHIDALPAAGAERLDLMSTATGACAPFSEEQTVYEAIVVRHDKIRLGDAYLPINQDLQYPWDEANTFFHLYRYFPADQGTCKNILNPAPQRAPTSTPPSQVP